MRLVKVRVKNFRSIDDSGEVEIDNVTCFVGKNESGKTAFLQALHRLNPLDDVKVEFKLQDYPRKDYTAYRSKHETNPADAVFAVYELGPEEMSAIESALGEGILKSKMVTAIKNYKNVRRWEFEVDEQATVRHILSGQDFMPEIMDQVSSAGTIAELVTKLNLFASEESVKKLLADINARYAKGVNEYIAHTYLDVFIPRYVYFDEYKIMRGKVAINYLKKIRDAKQYDRLDKADRTFLSLIDWAGVQLEDIDRQQDHELAIAGLEAASYTITRQMFNYWSQNDQLRVRFHREEWPNTGDEKTTGTILDIRIENMKHQVTVPFDERSRGFIWFFSFLAYFSQLKNQGVNMILLLDEPGLSLHAKAQGDLLKFIYEGLAPEHQVLYSTHSPFMVDPNRLENVRTVEDDKEKGTVINSDVLRTDEDTFYPLQAALGYELAQTLFVGPNILLVEGESDMRYLNMLNQAVIRNGGDGLDPRWVIVPVQGAGKLSTYASILAANKINIAILVDDSKDDQRISKLKEMKTIGPGHIISVGEIVGRSDADIEDLFDPAFYLDLVSQTYNGRLPQKLRIEDLPKGNPRIVRRVEDYFKDKGINGGRFRHNDPANCLVKEHVRLLPTIDKNTIGRATSLFERINALLS